MQLIGFIGIAFFVFLAFIFSKNKKNIDWKLVIWGIVMQFLIAGITLGKGLISIIPFFIWVWAISWYNLYALIFSKKNTNKIISTVISFIITVSIIFIIYKLGKTISSFVLSLIWYLFIILGVTTTSAAAFGKNIKLPKGWANIFGILLSCAILGSLIANEKTGADFFDSIGNAVNNFISFSHLGGKFVFGKLFTDMGFIFIINSGVSVIFIVAFIALIDSLGLMNQIIISISRFVDWNMRGMGITPLSGAETIVSISSIPVGGDNLFLVKNYLDKLTKSEIILSISSIMATVSSNTIVAFISLGVSPTHLIAASVMSVPAVIVLGKIYCPEVENPITRGSEIEVVKDENYGKPMPALMVGTVNGLRSVLMIGASLIVFISLIGAIDGILLKLDAYVDGQLLNGIKNSYNEYNGIVPGSLKTLLGYIFSPLSYIMGTPKEDIIKMGYLMGTKVALNEVVAYSQLGEFIQANALTHKSVIIASFALCGFSNPGTVAIMLGKILPFAGENKNNYINLIFKTMFIGAGASWMTAAIAGIISGLI